MQKRMVSVLLSGTIVGGIIGAAQPASAQSTSSTADPSPSVALADETDPAQVIAPSASVARDPVNAPEEVIITGTRIPQPNLTSASPVTVLTSQEVKLQGTSRTEDLINSLPQSFASQGSNISNGASGTATINLRNLGASRTLVLINGRRLQPGDNLTPVPDINFVPTQLIKRVDVLTGGASSVYGADAVGGVVNFIMDTNFTGLRIDAQASTFQHDNRAGNDIIAANEARGFRAPHGLSTNGGAQDIALIAGSALADGRGHAQVYATYRKQDPVLQSSRDYSFCALSALSESQAAALNRRFSCQGSSTSATGTFFQFDPIDFSFIDSFQVGNTNQFVDGSTTFNFAPYNYFQRPDERYTFGGFADYEISQGAKPHLEVMFMDDRSDAQIAPSGDFGDTSILNCDNPLLSAQQRSRICAPGRTFTDPNVINPVTGQLSQLAVVQVLRRNVEGGGRDSDIQHTAFRVVGGIRGNPLKGISYDAYYQFGRTNRTATSLHYFSVTRLTRALDVVADANGNPVCRAVVTGADPNCIPYNIFTAGGVSEAALNYLEVPGLQRGTVEENIAHFDLTLKGSEYGLKTPWAENGVGLNVGAEYRKEKSDFLPDGEFQSGDLAGSGGKTPPVNGQFNVRELFAEAQIPIVEHQFIDLLEISGGYRYSDYKVGSTSFKTNTYKIAAEFAPIRDIRFRGSYNRAVRAPNIVELFFPQAVGLGGTVDPCSGPAVNGSVNGLTAAQCALTGVTAAQFGKILPNTANQYNALFGGNPDLAPEKADTLTAGVVIQPRFIPGLALTADYFNIKVKNVIGTEAYGDVFSRCFAGDAAQCALIHRAPGTGSLWLSSNGFVELTNQNFPGTALTSKGWDFNGSYSHKLAGIGTLSASFTGTLQGDTRTIGGAGTGHFSPDSIPINKFRSKTRVGVALAHGLGVSGQWRHFSPVTCEGSPDCDDPGNAKIKAQDYFDLALTARIASRFNFRLGANNVFDKAPPVVGGQVLTGVFGSGNTYPQIYDALGRYMFAGITVDY